MCDLKCPDWIKKCVVDLVYYKNKNSENIQRIKRQLFSFHTVSHFLNLISQDFWCPYLFVSADIAVPVYTSKTPPSSDHIVIVKLAINICTLS